MQTKYYTFGWLLKEQIERDGKYVSDSDLGDTFSFTHVSLLYRTKMLYIRSIFRFKCGPF